MEAHLKSAARMIPLIPEQDEPRLTLMLAEEY
jgi:hypothetical protein